jgi:hypothetical protein
MFIFHLKFSFWPNEKVVGMFAALQRFERMWWVER